MNPPQRLVFKATYTPDDYSLDRRRQEVIIDDGDVMAAMAKAMIAFGLKSTCDEILNGYLGDIGDDDTSEGWKWLYSDHGGYWNFEWCSYPEDHLAKSNRECKDGLGRVWVFCRRDRTWRHGEGKDQDVVTQSKHFDGKWFIRSGPSASQWLYDTYKEAMTDC